MTQLLLLVQNRPAYAIVVLIGLILVVRMLILRILRKKAIVYYAFLFPGVVLHEVSHIIGCIIVGAEIKKASLFNSQGGYVVHEKPTLPIIGDLIVSIIPLAVGICTIFFLTKYYLGNILGGELSPSQLGKTVFILYLGVSIIANMLPSWQDFTNASYGFIIFFCALIMLEAKFTVFKEQLFSIAVLMSASLAVLILVLAVSYIANILHVKN